MLAVRPFMGSLVAGTACISRFCPKAVVGICRTVGRLLSSNALSCRDYSDAELGGRLQRSAEASLAAHPLEGTPLSREFSAAVSKTETFGADRLVYARTAYPESKSEGFRVYRLPRAGISTNLEPQLTHTALKDEVGSGGNYKRASRNVARESRHDSPTQRFLCGKDQSIGSAFGRDNKHPHSARTASEAIAILKDRKQLGLSIDSYMFVEVLKRCSELKDLAAARQVHDYVLQGGLEKHPYVATSLLNVYIKCGRVKDAYPVFVGLEKTDRNVITWNMMIGAYAKSGCGVEAYELFLQMKRDGFTPDAITYLSILNASASAGALEWVKEVHGHAREAGLDSDLRVGNALLHMYAKSCIIDDARLVFDRMEERDVITWNIIIAAYAETGCGGEAYTLFLQMKREGLTPNAITYVNILNASASAGALEWVKEVHGHARRAGLESDLRVGGALVHMYGRSGSVHDARLVFDGMVERNVITWSAMIGAYAESGCGAQAYGLFLRMKREGYLPNAITYLSILNASASAGPLEWVKDVHSDARKAGLDLDLRVGNALIHMYAKSGSINDARLIFNRMRKRDVVTFTAMIGGLAQHGCGHEALKLFKKMNADCVKPDGTLFVALLSACCHAGLVDDGPKLFSAMTQDYGIRPNVVHYNCMVDLLGRAGHLEEAKVLIGNMPVEPNEVTWTTLLGACKTYGNVELGEFAGKEVLKLDPTDAGAYVLLSNIYAAAGKWEKVSWVRTMMQERGVRKEPGCSWIEVDNKVHEFVVGDVTHPESKSIYTELKNLTEKLKAEGYIPDTRHVLLNLDEEDKEGALCSHSEKLAIAYGMLRVPPGEPIRVFKNLRVCSDCHAATKLISKVTGREIIAKDANRFHHFKDGVCSCGDYW